MQENFAGANGAEASLPLGPKAKGGEADGRGVHAPTGIVDRQDGSLPPDLAEVNRAWPGLPGAIRAGILAMVRATKG